MECARATSGKRRGTEQAITLKQSGAIITPILPYSYIEYNKVITPRTAHELAHLSCVAQALKTYADELPPIAQAGGNMCSSCSSYNSSRGQ